MEFSLHKFSARGCVEIRVIARTSTEGRRFKIRLILHPRVYLFMKGQSNDDSRYVSKYTEGTFNDMFNGYYICSSIVVLVDSGFVFLPV